MNNARPTKKTAAKKTAAGRSDKPAPVTFSIKDVLPDPDEQPFVLAVAGRPVQAVSPLDIDFEELYASQADTRQFFALLFPDDHEAVLREFNTVRAMLALTQALVTHYGLEDFVAAQS